MTTQLVQTLDVGLRCVSRGFGRIAYLPKWMLVGGGLTTMALLSFWAMAGESSTMDEAGKLLAGYVSLRGKDHRLLQQKMRPFHTLLTNV